MPKENELPEAIPSGSLPLEDNSNDMGNQAPGTAQDAAALILGKFKSADDLAKAYQELEKDHGRIGKEVGDLRKQSEIQSKQTDLLLNQLTNLVQEKTPPTNTGAPDFDKQVADIRNAVENGEMDIGEALARTVGLTSQKAEYVAAEAIKRARAEESALSAKERFIKENPDFYDVQRSGALQAIRGENPMHDDFSAFAEYKRREAMSNLETERKAAYEKGIAEAAKISQGAEAAGRVIGKSGAAIRTPTNTKPMTDYERNQGMLDVLTKIRGG